MDYCKTAPAFLAFALLSSNLAVDSFADVTPSAQASGGPFEEGPNKWGSLIIATQPGAAFTLDDSDYCDDLALQHCDEAVTDHHGTSAVVLWVVAAFNELASPRLKGVEFGWTYDESDIVVNDWGSCGDFHITTASWPGSGEGIALVFNETRTTSLVEVCWLSAYASSGPSSIELVGHPIQGAHFADDSLPSILDEITNLGSFGFFEAGDAPCPPNTLIGACCFSTDECVLLEEGPCESAGGSFAGWDTSCDSPCPILTDSACCLSDGSCVIAASEQACTEHFGGTYLPQTSCDPNPCAPSPTHDASWGEIKARFN